MSTMLLRSILSFLVLVTNLKPGHTIPIQSQTESVQHGSTESILTTTSGIYIGHTLPLQAQVIEYLGVNYGQAPVGDLRFSASRAFLSTTTYIASQQPPDCPYVAQDWGSVPGESYSTAPRIMAQESADGYNVMDEDCLKMNIWIPKASQYPKPVMVFLYGGGFNRGSINNPAYNGVYMAAQQDVIVISFKCVIIEYVGYKTDIPSYRVNIFGFANAPGADTNVALRDVRLALEWVRDNIEAIHGDRNRITIFGQSQGAYLISYYDYAYPDDQIVNSMIQMSGTAFSPGVQKSTIKAQTWRQAAANVGCDFAGDDQVLLCMRSQNTSTILAAWSSVQPSDPESNLPFGPVVDDKLIFANYTERTLSGQFSKKPLLIGSNSNEAGFYVMRYAGKNKITLTQAQQDAIGFGLFSCPTALDAATRSRFTTNHSSSPIYRYEYFGDWPNLRLYPGSGAYHTSETSMIFGTMEEFSGAPSTQLQSKVSDYMQHAWASFARDPIYGLERLGWPQFEPEKETLIRLGFGNETVASYAHPELYDQICQQLQHSQ